MFKRSPVTVHTSRTEVYRTPDGGDAITSEDPRGTVLIGQVGDVQVKLDGGVTLVVWPNGTVELVTPNTEEDESGTRSGIAFDLPDRDVIGNGVTAIPVRYL